MNGEFNKYIVEHIRKLADEVEIFLKDVRCFDEVNIIKIVINKLKHIMVAIITRRQLDERKKRDAVDDDSTSG